MEVFPRARGQADRRSAGRPGQDGRTGPNEQFGYDNRLNEKTLTTRRPGPFPPGPSLTHLRDLSSGRFQDQTMEHMAVVHHPNRAKPGMLTVARGKGLALSGQVRDTTLSVPRRPQALLGAFCSCTGLRLVGLLVLCLGLGDCWWFRLWGWVYLLFPDFLQPGFLSIGQDLEQVLALLGP